MKTGKEQGFRQALDRPWHDNDASRRRQLREDAARPLAENLAEGLALSEFLSTFTGPPDRVERRAAPQTPGT